MSGRIDSFLALFRRPVHLEDLPFDHQVATLEARLDVAKSLADQCDIREQLVSMVFHHKIEHQDFELTGTAKKVYDIARDITAFNSTRNLEEAQNTFILEHGADYAFLTNPRHRIYKHIQVLRNWGTENAGVCTVNGSDDLFFNHLRNSVDGRTPIRELRETYTTKRNGKFHGMDFSYDLNHDAIYLRTEAQTMSLQEALGDGAPVARLNHNFQIPFHDGNHYLEIVTDCATDYPGWFGHHAWIRLIDGEGRVSSIGKLQRTGATLASLYAQNKISYANADRYEWLQHDTMEPVRVRISEERYQELHGRIEECLLSQREQDYNFFTGNCADWVIEMTQGILNIDREQCRIHEVYMLFPKTTEFFKKHAPWVVNKVLTFFIGIYLYASHFARLLLMLIMGATSRNNGNRRSASMFWKALFNPNLTSITHPHYLREHLRKNLHDIMAVDIAELNSVEQVEVHDDEGEEKAAE